ncbi:MAG: phosphoglycerate kinase [Planctomycetes bacterium]|nr:phosphoglycerate kinase [Planctomycetota bacterium]
MKIKSIENIRALAGKKVLVRTDYNVPMAKGKIKDDFKIKKQLPTLRYLLKEKARIIIITHLGRPHPKKIDAGLSLAPIAVRLSKLLGQKVKFLNDYQGFRAGSEISKMKEGDIIMLENMRFSGGEESNDIKLARQLSVLADVYINDAFAVSHRAHATVSAIRKFLPGFAGLLLAAEVINLHRIINPKKPLVIVVGGAKIETKLPLIFKLHKKAYRILVGGALANSFLAAKNINIGRSLIDRASVKFARDFRTDKIMLPIDVIASHRISGGEPTVKNVHKIGQLDYIYDIGPQTIRFYTEFIKQANTIVWNGPMGVFEKEEYKHGTLAIGRLIASRSTGRAFGVVGGGETVEALKMTKMLSYIDWVSTGGGAMLEYLGGVKLPGLKGIVG